MGKNPSIRENVSVKVGWVDDRRKLVGFKTDAGTYAICGFGLLFVTGFKVGFIKHHMGDGAVIDMRENNAGKLSVTRIHEIAGQAAVLKGKKTKREDVSTKKASEQHPVEVAPTPTKTEREALPIGSIFSGIIPERIFADEKRPWKKVGVSAVLTHGEWVTDVNYAPVHLHLSALSHELAMLVNSDQCFVFEVVAGHKPDTTTAKVLRVCDELKVIEVDEAA